MEPTALEANKVQVSRLLCHVAAQTSGLDELPNVYIKASKSSYGEGVDLNKATALLCSKIRKMSKMLKDSIVYDPYSKLSRELANWWEEHQVADKERETMEKQKIAKAALRRTALAKLTERERNALDL